MNRARPTFALQSFISYALLALAGIWLVWTAIEIRYLQGWYEAQGTTNFYYPIAELIAGLVMLAIGIGVARTKGWPLAPALAVTVLLFAELFWLGFTR